jgi:hypothetical protein|tara:strand:- start:1187 stop:1372 length:186 start_codon:yes stop_codon:yes gene_type:complete
MFTTAPGDPHAMSEGFQAPGKICCNAAFGLEMPQRSIHIGLTITGRGESLGTRIGRAEKER